MTSPYMLTYEQSWLSLMDRLDEMNALSTIIHPYFMDPADLDTEGSFV